MEKTITFTCYMTGLPVSVDVNTVEDYRGNSKHTTLYFKDDTTGLVCEDFDKVDELITEALK